MAKHITKSHNKTCILYHLVCPVKYRRKALIYTVPNTLVRVCKQISERYDIHFIEIGTDLDHVHFLIQSVPTYAPSRIAQIVKSLTAREIFKRHPAVKTVLWGGQFWSGGFYLNTVGASANETVIRNYVRRQGRKYDQFHKSQLRLF